MPERLISSYYFRFRTGNTILSTMITLGHYLKPYSKRIALGTVIKIVGTITELFLPWILSYMIDEVAPEKNVARIFLWGAVMLACAVVALLGNITANRMASKVARDTTESMRFDLFDKTLNLSDRKSTRLNSSH